MNKKLVALLMAGAMIAGNAMAVMAEETEAETEAAAGEVMEAEFDEANASFEGTWVPFEAGFQLYVPSDWNMQEISEEDAAKGLIFAVTAPDESGCNMVVTATEVTDDYDNAKVAEELATAYTDVQEGIFNGIEVVTYSAEDADAAGIAFLDGAGYMYAVNCSPVSDTDFAPVALEMLTSVSVAEDAEAVETEAE